MKLRPELENHPALRGVVVGACIETLKAFGDIAHAHWSADPNFGWICIMRMADLNPTNVIHELAHVLRHNDRHDEAWKATVRSLGGRPERRYTHPKP